MKRRNRLVLSFSAGLIAVGVVSVSFLFVRESVAEARERRAGRGDGFGNGSGGANGAPELTEPRTPDKAAPRYSVRDVTPASVGPDYFFPVRFNDRGDVLGVLIPPAPPAPLRPQRVEPNARRRPKPWRLGLLRGGSFRVIGVLPVNAGYRSFDMNARGEILCFLTQPGGAAPPRAESGPPPARLFRWRDGRLESLDVAAAGRKAGLTDEEAANLLQRTELFLNDAGQAILSGRSVYLFQGSQLSALDVTGVCALTGSGLVVAKPTTQMRMSEAGEGYANLVFVNQKSSGRRGYNIGNATVESVNGRDDVLLSNVYPGQYNGRSQLSVFRDNKLSPVATVMVQGGTRTFLNSRGQVAGMNRGPVYYEFRGSVRRDQGRGPFLWQDGSLYDLNELVGNDAGWEISQVAGLNDRGELLCTGYRDGKPKVHILLLSPKAAQSASGGATKPRA